MDILSAFKSEIFRPLTTIVVPGTLALGPFIPIVGYYVPAVHRFWEEHPTAFSTLALICILAAGLILEDLGSVVESKVWDPRLKKDPTWQQNWDDYLMLELKDEIIGQPYLESIVARLKFELSMLPTLIVGMLGVVWMNGIWHFWSCYAFLGFVAVILLIVTYLTWESYQSTKVLAKTRPLIIAAAAKRVK
jgi:hypothetical protein